MLSAREILCYFAIRHEGDWGKIYLAVSRREDFDEEVARAELAKLKCNYITIFDDNYPNCFMYVMRPPFVLFYYGDINLLLNYHKCLSVVGSRECTNYGAESTRRLISAVADKYTIVSGLAAGIDSIAHEAAIRNKGKTIAILGSGIDYIYPKENFELYQ